MPLRPGVACVNGLVNLAEEVNLHKLLGLKSQATPSGPASHDICFHCSIDRWALMR